SKKIKFLFQIIQCSHENAGIFIFSIFIKKIHVMISRFLTFAFFFLLHFAEAQNEFITIWQPGITTTPVPTVDAPFQANANQIWFPGIGQNYSIEWEEVGYSSNNGTMINVTSTSQVLIDFGPTREEGQGATTKY